MHQHTIFWEQQQSCFSWDDEDFSSFIEFHFIAKNCSLQTKLVKLCILQKNLGKYSNITCENFLKTHKRHLCTKNVWLMIMFIIVAWVNKMLYLTRNVLSQCLKTTKKDLTLWLFLDFFFFFWFFDFFYFFNSVRHL